MHGGVGKIMGGAYSLITLAQVDEGRARGLLVGLQKTLRLFDFNEI
jgi:hypothetical protein